MSLRTARSCLALALVAAIGCASRIGEGAGAADAAAGGMSDGQADAARPDAKGPVVPEEVSRALTYGMAVVGTPYGWWLEGPIPAGAPMYATNGPPPPPEQVRAQSVNCAGLTNLMLREVGKPLPHHPSALSGGTYSYQLYYADVAEPFNLSAEYPTGTLIARRYRDEVDQGHVAVVLDDGRVLQSFAWKAGDTEPGANATYTIVESHDGGYYEYAVRPEHWLVGSGE